MKSFHLPKVNIFLIIPSLLLLTLGLTELFWMNQRLFQVQLTAAIIGIVIFIFTSQSHQKYWESFSFYIYLASILFLIIPLITGTITRGSSRWIDIGPVSIQPSEITRPLLIVCFATYAARINKFGLINLLIYSGIFMLPAILLLIQPDLGSTLLLGAGWIGILLISKVPWKYYLLGLLIFCLAAPVGWNFLHDYQQNRIITFINPGSDPLGTGYNVIQSRLAVGSGQIFGKGLGRGTQSQLRFLPEYHTDFMYASIAEELGFVGSSIIILLYALLFIAILLIAQNREQSFSGLVVIGLFVSLFSQVIINIGMNLGVMPVTGITLPFLSYGGSSIVATAIMLGIINSFWLGRQAKSSLQIH